MWWRTFLGYLQFLFWIPASHTFEISGRYFADIYHNTHKTHEGRAGNSRMTTQTRPGDLLKIVHKETGMWYYVWRGDACRHVNVRGMLRCVEHPYMLPGSTTDEGEGIYASFGLTKQVADAHGAYAIRLIPLRIRGSQVPVFTRQLHYARPLWVLMTALWVWMCM